MSQEHSCYSCLLSLPVFFLFFHPSSNVFVELFVPETNRCFHIPQNILSFLYSSNIFNSWFVLSTMLQTGYCDEQDGLVTELGFEPGCLPFILLSLPRAHGQGPRGSCCSLSSGIKQDINPPFRFRLGILPSYSPLWIHLLGHLFIHPFIHSAYLN